MPLPWLRLYTEFVSDPKIQMLAFEDQRHFVALLCLKGNGVLDSECPNDPYRERMIAKALGLDPVSAAEAKRRLAESGLIGDDWQPSAWDKRQFESDSSAERTRKYREKQKGNVTETSQRRSGDAIDKIRTDTDTDSDQKIHTAILAIKAKYPKAAREDWITAEKRIRQLIAEGSTWNDLEAGVERYQAYCRATNRMVQNPANFFGAIDRPWLATWDLPKTKADIRLQSNVSAAEEFMRRTEPT